MNSWSVASGRVRLNFTRPARVCGLKSSSAKQMEEELLRTRKLESLGVLAGGIAHDFNHFLTIIQASIELAEMRLARRRVRSSDS